jgi:hypothetical protein
VRRPSVSGPLGAAAELDVAFVGEDGRWRHLQRDVAAALAGWTRVSDLVGLQVVVGLGRCVLTRNHIIPDSIMCSVPLFLKRQATAPLSLRAAIRLGVLNSSYGRMHLWTRSVEMGT